MIVKLVVPIIDTESINCDSDIKMSREEFGNLVYDTFKKNDRAIESYTQSMVTGKRGYQNPYVYDIPTETDRTNNIKDNTFKDVECECQIMDVNKQEIDDNWLQEYVNNQKMFLLAVNINPLEIDWNVEGEIRFWIDDSERILRDETLDDTMKLKYLPCRTLKIRTESNEYTINNCKIVENRSQEKFPCYFIIIIERIN